MRRHRGPPRAARDAGAIQRELFVPKLAVRAVIGPQRRRRRGGRRREIGADAREFRRIRGLVIRGDDASHGDVPRRRLRVPDRDRAVRVVHPSLPGVRVDAREPDGGRRRGRADGRF
eukprot:31334-Pelagococcus_subviridis.AAC.11